MFTTLTRSCSCFLLALLFVSTIAAEESASPEPLTANQIVAQMVMHNKERANELKYYTGTRDYRLVYTGFPMRKEAEITVKACYQAPDKKEFTIASQSGSGFIISHVLKRLLESEQEASTEAQQARTALDERNYRFELVGRDVVENRPAYLLKVTPKIDNKFLYRGKVWVDAADFAVVQIEAEPAKRPSFWISKTQIHHVYKKIGDFWLPAENRSTTDVRLGGVATLTINYTNYEVNKNSTASASVILHRPEHSQASY